MKYIITISLLLLSPVLYAQTKNPAKPANKNPNIAITPGINTTITKQPSGIPNSNTNPTTGTVISLKTKSDIKAAKPKAKSVPDKMPVVNKADTTLKNSRSKPGIQKQAAIKN